MVDPLEAKRLAAKQMEAIKAKQRFKRTREIEAINGAWAMIGLTAGLVIEGHTGKSIIDQVWVLNVARQETSHNEVGISSTTTTTTTTLF
nr:Chloroa_b-bind domain-containing protein [Ipomoea batatas]